MNNRELSWRLSLVAALAFAAACGGETGVTGAVNEDSSSAVEQSVQRSPEEVIAEIDGGWSHANLRSASGTNIAVDFVKAVFPNGPGRTVVMATNNWVNVQRDDLTANDTVEVVFGHRVVITRPDGTVFSDDTITRTLRLRYAEGGRFTELRGGDLGLYGATPQGTLTSSQTIEVRINGVPEIDPVQPEGATTFNLDLFNA